MSEALPSPWTCHNLRHRFATAAYRASHYLLLVQRLMGHSKPETTANYISLDTNDAAATVALAAIAA